MLKVFENRILRRIFGTFENLKIEIYKTMILPVVIHGCETWSLTLREICRLRVFENRILRRIFGPIDANGECRGTTISHLI